MDIAKEAGDSWVRLDPAALRREAELKEAKHKRQQEQRDIRTEARRERRHQKAEAKRARKANVKPAAKWNAERKAADKLKKIANRPAKLEKRRRRLGLRAEKLEAQARKLMVEAQKAPARFEYLNEEKAKEERAREAAAQAEKEKEKRLVESGDYVPLEDDSDREEDEAENGPFQREDQLLVDGHPRTTRSSASQTATGNEPSAEAGSTVDDIDTFAEIPDRPRPGAQQPIPPPNGALDIQSIANDVAEEKPKLKSKDKKRKSKPSAGPAPEAVSETAPGVVPEDVATPGVEDGAGRRAKKDKKKKKRKHGEEAAPRGSEDPVSNEAGPITIQDSLDADREVVNGDEKVSEKKNNGKRRKREAEATVEAVIDDEALPTKKPKRGKEKKSKKAKGQELEYDDDAGSSVQRPGADVSEQWNVGALGGGAARQDKFLRLLGSKKGKASASREEKDGSLHQSTARERLDMTRVNEDLEKQFVAGVRMKFDSGGQRRGLGA